MGSNWWLNKSFSFRNGFTSKKNPIYQGLIKFYANYETDQLAILNNIGASKGKLIRFASDFTLVPSIIEAAGLVPAEGLSMGSATISSYLQGLQDQCKNHLIISTHWAQLIQ